VNGSVTLNIVCRTPARNSENRSRHPSHFKVCRMTGPAHLIIVCRIFNFLFRPSHAFGVCRVPASRSGKTTLRFLERVNRNETLLIFLSSRFARARMDAK